MRRLALVSLLVVAFVIAAAGMLVALPLTGAGASFQATAPPTNTARPTIPPTNTPRPTATLVPSPTASPAPVAYGPEEFPDGINPLTGLPYPSDEARNRRTLIIKVSNFPELVRPQSGLDKADIVFEYEVEGAVTRFAALYRSQGADHVGSVRSARLLDLELVPMFGALLAYSGANQWIDDYILKADWHWRALSPQHGVNDPCQRFPRDGLAYEHTMFCDAFKLWDVATERQINDGRKMQGLAFSTAPDPGAEPAKDIYIDYWNERQDTRWQYNTEDGRYYRWNSGIPHVDAISGKQLSTDNVVILEAEHIDRPDILDSEVSGVVIETVLWGSGRAWLFRDGLWYKGEWHHAQGRIGLWLTFPGASGPMHLKPGQTWFEVVRPVMYGVEIAAEPVNARGTEMAIYAAQTQSAAATATYMAPYVTASPTPPTPTPVDLP